ncbi:uncharacterized protein LOC144327575 [Podarcis muralis]
MGIRSGDRGVTKKIGGLRKGGQEKDVLQNRQDSKGLKKAGFCPMFDNSKTHTVHDFWTILYIKSILCAARCCLEGGGRVGGERRGGGGEERPRLLLLPGAPPRSRQRCLGASARLCLAGFGLPAETGHTRHSLPPSACAEGEPERGIAPARRERELGASAAFIGRPARTSSITGTGPGEGGGRPVSLATPLSSAGSPGRAIPPRRRSPTPPTLWLPEPEPKPEPVSQEGRKEKWGGRRGRKIARRVKKGEGRTRRASNPKKGWKTGRMKDRERKRRLPCPRRRPLVIGSAAEDSCAASKVRRVERGPCVARWPGKLRRGPPCESKTGEEGRAKGVPSPTSGSETSLHPRKAKGFPLFLYINILLSFQIQS